MKKTTACSYTVHSFMYSELGLRGGELLIFAIIYSFTKGEPGLYWGTQEFLSNISGLSRSTVWRTLTSLSERGYIEKATREEHEGYRSTHAVMQREDEPDEPPNDAEKKLPLPQRMRGYDLKITSFIKDGEKRPKYEFHEVGDYGCVSMTAEQYKRLLELLPSETLHAYIRKLELLIMREGYRTFNPYKTIRRWILENASV